MGNTVLDSTRLDSTINEHGISYQLTTVLNENGSTRFSSKVFTHSFSGFSYYLKNVIIDRYIINCK